MPVPNYGVLRGSVDRGKREDNDPKSPHYQIRVVDAAGRPWRVPVNVLSADKSEVVFWVKDPLPDHPILQGLLQLATGFTPRPAGTAMTALDFVRAPLFRREDGRHLPPTGDGARDDLQDYIEMYIDQIKEANGELFAFGAKFTTDHDPHPLPIDQEFGTKAGVHDIHMNQGNPHSHPKDFFADNGVFQDGGLLFRFPDHTVGIFMKFQTQTFDTDDRGNPTTGDSPPPVGAAAVYIERALVNPAGDDPGKEIVVLGNTTAASVDLTGWKIVDKNHKADVIRHVLLPAGGSQQVLLTGDGAQLGNQGGTITLVDSHGHVVHSVSYSGAQAKAEDQFIRFRH